VPVSVFAVGAGTAAGRPTSPGRRSASVRPGSASSVRLIALADGRHFYELCVQYVPASKT